MKWHQWPVNAWDPSHSIMISAKTFWILIRWCSWRAAWVFVSHLRESLPVPISMLLRRRRALKALSAFSYSAKAKSCSKLSENDKTEKCYLCKTLRTPVLVSSPRFRERSWHRAQNSVEKGGEWEARTLPQRDSTLLMRLLSASDGIPLTNTTVLMPSLGSAIIP